MIDRLEKAETIYADNGCSTFGSYSMSAAVSRDLLIQRGEVIVY